MKPISNQHMKAIKTAALPTATKLAWSWSITSNTQPAIWVNWKGRCWPEFLGRGTGMSAARKESCRLSIEQPGGSPAQSCWYQQDSWGLQLKVQEFLILEWWCQLKSLDYTSRVLIICWHVNNNSDHNLTTILLNETRPTTVESNTYNQIATMMKVLLALLIILEVVFGEFFFATVWFSGWKEEE